MDWQSLSGDSTARHINFQNGTVTFRYEDYESDLHFDVSVATDTAITRAAAPNSRNQFNSERPTAAG